VDAAMSVVMRGAGDCLHRIPYQFLLTMACRDIAAMVNIEMPAGAQEAGMLPRAVVVERIGRATRSREGHRRCMAGGPMRATFQRRLVQASLGQHGASEFDMFALAGMGGAGERQFPVAEAIGVSRTGFHQRKRLDRLDGRARKDGTLGVTGLPQLAAIGIINRYRAAMDAFQI